MNGEATSHGDLLLQVRHVHRSFDGTQALADVSLDIPFQLVTKDNVDKFMK